MTIEVLPQELLDQVIPYLDAASLLRFSRALSKLDFIANSLFRVGTLLNKTLATLWPTLSFFYRFPAVPPNKQTKLFEALSALSVILTRYNCLAQLEYIDGSTIIDILPYLPRRISIRLPDGLRDDIILQMAQLGKQVESLVWNTIDTKLQRDDSLNQLQQSLVLLNPRRITNLPLSLYGTLEHLQSLTALAIPYIKGMACPTSSFLLMPALRTVMFEALDEHGRRAMIQILPISRITAVKFRVVDVGKLPNERELLAEIGFIDNIREWNKRVC
ncbi:hypothetical protein BCR33DRAFT_724337 [Rhizoclosmatium globosum]|uniref:F-box domain-containing protein n=1 Tax=Rhizoclosmatium globosum TaxID=329046 RepID=A0A1Y2B6I8_9FUNG|nr:hypothetical protein BCR33DRAFT_724337 [Rhizoclosmatium globosum]|eukprot:ORY30296.1 hypothetical protein BCR33DRAFT_724337 [Rhizoclosmatium globosum]